MTLYFSLLETSYSYPGMAPTEKSAALSKKTQSSQSTHLSHRHIIIFESDTEKIWGSYFFAVENPYSKPLKLLTP